MNGNFEKQDSAYPYSFSKANDGTWYVHYVPSLLKIKEGLGFNEAVREAENANALRRIEGLTVAEVRDALNKR